MSTVVCNWFGAYFSNLHPLLQKLHLHGGRLNGEVNLEFAKGLKGLLGRRLAAKIGLPLKPGIYPFEVVISHNPESLIWTRQFNKNHIIKSVFTPHGKYPKGFWSEKTGPTELLLGVDIVDGGWYWRLRKISLRGKVFPQWLLPSTEAYKTIKNGQYEFSVSLTFPLLGQLFRFSGLLDAVENSK